MKPLTEFLTYIEVKDGRSSPMLIFCGSVLTCLVCKTEHFEQFKKWSKKDYSQMVSKPCCINFWWVSSDDFRFYLTIKLKIWKSRFRKVCWKYTIHETSMRLTIWIGVTFASVRDRTKGIRLKDYNSGLDQWRRYQYIKHRIPDDRILSSKAKLVGYAGADKASAIRYEEGKRRVKSARAARWGHGLYVTDDPRM